MPMTVPMGAPHSSPGLGMSMDDDNDSSDDGVLSDHSEELHPETGFDPFLAATRRARQQSAEYKNSPLLSSASASSLPSSLQVDSDNMRAQESQRWSSIARYWGKVVDQAMFFPKQGRIDLSQRHITDISPTIADLSRYVSLPPPRYDKDDSERQAEHNAFSAQSQNKGLVRHASQLTPLSAENGEMGRRTLSRSQSAFQPSARTHSFARTDSAASALSSRSAASYRDHRDKQATLSLFLGSNCLTKLPSALFQLHNLRVLSLRSNKLKHLPAAIGDLQNLSELQIANNEFEYLPAEIVRLRLDVFTWFPNPYFAKPPKSGLLTVRPLLSHKIQYNNQQASLKLANVAEVTPVKEGSDDHLTQPPPLLRPPSAVAGRQRTLDRTRSDMQVEGFLVRGVDRLDTSAVPPIREQEDDNGNMFDLDDTQSSLADTETDSTRASGIESMDDQEAQRQRILEAAFEEDESDEAPFGDDTLTDNESAFLRGKVVGRSRVLGQKQSYGLPSLQELCIRKLLSPYDVAQNEAEGILSPFLSPVLHSSGGVRKRSSSRNTSRPSTPNFGPASRARATSFGSVGARTRSFSSNGGPEDSRLGKRMPTLLEAYENGTLQSVVGEVSRGLVSMLEAARRSATHDWGTKARMPRTTTATMKSPFARTQSNLGSFPLDPSEDTESSTFKTANAKNDDNEEFDLFGSIAAPGSLDRGDDANQNPWFSRCPNPKHCEERRSGTTAGPIGTNRSEVGLFRNRQGFGSSSSISSLGTQLGRGKAGKEDTRTAADMGRELSTSTSSGVGQDGCQSPISQSSSVGTVSGGLESGSSSSLPSNTVASTSHVRFNSPGARGPATYPRNWSSVQNSFSSGPRTLANRPNSTNFVRGFSSLSVLSASGMRSTSFAAATGDVESERDWPLTEVQHRTAPIFSKAGETRLEWISHIGGVKVAKLNDAHVDLDQEHQAETSASVDTDGHRSMLGTMMPFENKDLIPILWRGCSTGCLDFLI